MLLIWTIPRGATSRGEAVAASVESRQRQSRQSGCGPCLVPRLFKPRLVRKAAVSITKGMTSDSDSGAFGLGHEESAGIRHPLRRLARLPPVWRHWWSGSQPVRTNPEPTAPASTLSKERYPLAAMARLCRGVPIGWPVYRG